MSTLSTEQRRLVSELVGHLAGIRGVVAVVLGGSHARGRAGPRSDVDLGILYSDAKPFAVATLRALAAEINDARDPVVTDFYEWGRWVNGGAWLTVRGHRIDLLYRSLEHLERVIADAEAGRYELDYAQQPPFGFFGPTYLGEVAVCVPLFDPDLVLPALKRRVATYPEALRRRVVQDCLWSVDFGLEAFAGKFAANGDIYATAGCLARCANQLVLALFALNRTYLLNDKTALAEIAAFPVAPRDFAQRLSTMLAAPGRLPGELVGAVDTLGVLFRETVALAENLYRPRYTAVPRSIPRADGDSDA